MVDPVASPVTGTGARGDRLASMDMERRIWLVSNAASGSNGEEALRALEQACADAGLRIAHSTTFPERELPTPSMLDAAEVDLVAIFTGDGTINALIAELAGWSGAVLVLPGGTMNLLYHRLHGDLPMEEVIARAGAGRARARRPGIIRGAVGDGHAGVLVGPGTSWNSVREAMREGNVLDIAGGTGEAIGETLEGEQVACIDPPLGRREGYPLLMLTPHDDGIEVAAFHAETAGDYLQQVMALIRRNFREGPHDILGRVERLRIAGAEGGAFGILVDGEPAQCGAQAQFTLAACEVDLLATGNDGR